MDANQVALLKKEQRRHGRSKARQALFISDYVFHKHFDIYQQAAQLYNQINQIYPRKPDLRRTEEFKIWRNDVMGQPTRVRRKPKIKRPHVFPAHANIPIAECIEPHVNFTVVDQPESPHIQPESPHIQPESPHIQPESPDIQPESPHIQPESPVHQTVKKGKVMELKIPLMKSPTETPRIVTEEVLQEDTPSLEPSLYTETLQIMTEEVLQEDTPNLEPSLYEEISPEVIERIVNELSQDPGLKDILTTVEEQVEFDQIGMDLDLLDDMRLENELENFILW